MKNELSVQHEIKSDLVAVLSSIDLPEITQTLCDSGADLIARGMAMVESSAVAGDERFKKGKQLNGGLQMIKMGKELLRETVSDQREFAKLMLAVEEFTMKRASFKLEHGIDYKDVLG